MREITSKPGKHGTITDPLLTTSKTNRPTTRTQIPVTSSKQTPLPLAPVQHLATTSTATKKVSRLCQCERLAAPLQNFPIEMCSEVRTKLKPEASSGQTTFSPIPPY